MWAPPIQNPSQLRKISDLQFPSRKPQIQHTSDKQRLPSVTVITTVDEKLIVDTDGSGAFPP